MAVFTLAEPVSIQGWDMVSDVPKDSFAVGEKAWLCVQAVVDRRNGVGSGLKWYSHWLFYTDQNKPVKVVEFTVTGSPWLTGAAGAIRGPGNYIVTFQHAVATTPRIVFFANVGQYNTVGTMTVKVVAVGSDNGQWLPDAAFRIP